MLLGEVHQRSDPEEEDARDPPCLGDRRRPFEEPGLSFAYVLLFLFIFVRLLGFYFALLFLNSFFNDLRYVRDLWRL